MKKLEQYYGKKVELADRECVESESDRILDEAREKNVSFLVVGDPYCATTHTDLALRARALGIQVKVFHNACIMSAVDAVVSNYTTTARPYLFVFFVTRALTKLNPLVIMRK